MSAFAKQKQRGAKLKQSQICNGAVQLSEPGTEKTDFSCSSLQLLMFLRKCMDVYVSFTDFLFTDSCRFVQRSPWNYREHTGAIPSAPFLWMFRDQVEVAGGRNTFYLLLGDPKASPGQRDYLNPAVHFGFTTVPFPSWMTLGILITYPNNLRWLLSISSHFQRPSVYLRS